jgi:hypothetical protein
MIADFSLVDNNPYFMIHPHQIAGETVLLCQPTHIGAKFDKNTLIFRSSVWNLRGELISAGWKKFFNDQEHLEIDPLPVDIRDGSLIEKIDGSLLIWSMYKDMLVIRTRGTVDASKLDNGYEIEFLKEKFPGVVQLVKDNPGYSVLTEWTTPTNVIVLRYSNEPDLYLLGMIDHADYSYVSQNRMDEVAKRYGIQRPRRYSFNTLDDMRLTVNNFKGVEGICFYYNNDQCIRKFKGADYLARHRMKSELSSLDRVIDFWFMSGQMKYQEFFDHCITTFDYEIACEARGFISLVYDAWKEVLVIEQSMKEKISELSGLPRKTQAEIIIQRWGKTNRASLAFQLLDGKQWNGDSYKKLLYQVLDK